MPWHFSERGKLMQNGIFEAFNSKMRGELLNETLFFGLDHAREIVAEWVGDYNAARPHTALGYQTDAAFAANSPSAQRDNYQTSALLSAG